jgi:hypothetical protein
MFLDLCTTVVTWCKLGQINLGPNQPGTEAHWTPLLWTPNKKVKVLILKFASLKMHIFQTFSEDEDRS